MGEVWLGQHELGLPVAIKVIASARARQAATQRAFLHEVRAVAQLTHPGIVMVLDYGELPKDVAEQWPDRLLAGSPYLVMEFADGGTLRPLVGRANPWPALEGILVALLDALAHAHARGVIHRDLKPDNALVVSSLGGRTLKLSDFGVAWSLENEEERQGPAGTAHFMAPEQVLGNSRDFSPATDLYALGCTAWTLATGRTVFPDRGRSTLFTAQLYDPPGEFAPLAAVPEAFESWLRTLLAKDARARFQRAADALWALKQLGEPTRPAAPLAENGELETTSITFNLSLVTLGSSIGDGDPQQIQPEQTARSQPKSMMPKASPMPTTWSAGALARPSLQLRGAGLGLFALRRIPMVGRDSQRDLLWSTLIMAQATARPKVAILRGPPGCGKSRLASWLCERAHEVGAATVLKGIYTAGSGATDGLGPMLRRHFRCLGLSRSELAARLTQVLLSSGLEDTVCHDILAEVCLGLPVDAVEVRAALRQYLERLGSERSVILWLDDVQWGAEALRFARHILEARSRCRVVILLTVQDDTPDDSSHAMLEALIADLAPRVIRVGPLPLTDQQRLVSELLGLEHGLAETVARRTSGNPLFAVQLVGDWVGRGLLELGEGGFSLRPGTRIEIPEALADLWSIRINEVFASRPAAARVALELGATFGPEVDANEWREACVLAGVTVPYTLLAELARVRLIRIYAAGNWSFEHGMLAETLQRMAREAGRLSSHHLICASVLSDSRHAGRRGRHLLAGGRIEEALRPLCVGAVLSRKAGRYDDAERLMRYWRRAIEALGLPTTDRRWAEGWAEHAEILLSRGRWGASHTEFERVLNAARANDWPDLLRAALYGTGAALRPAEPQAAETYLKESLELALAANDPRVVERASRSLGVLAIFRGASETAITHLNRALGLADELGDHRSWCACQQRLGDVYCLTGDLEQAREHLHLSFSGYLKSHYRPGIAAAANSLGELERAAGNLSTAERHYQQAHLTWEALGHPDAFLADANLAMVSIDRGKFAEAETMLRRAVEQLGQAKSLTAEGVVWLLYATVAVLQEDWDSWEERFSRAMELIQTTQLIDRDLANYAKMAGDRALADRPDVARSAWGLAVTQLRGLGEGSALAEVEAALASL